MRTFFIAVAAGCLALSGPLPAANNYVQHNLVSAAAGLADRSDPSLAAPWGIAFSSTGPFWIANQGTGVATVYNSAGAPATGPVNLPGQPAAIVRNSAPDFLVAPGVPALFLFSSAAGTISAWNNSALGGSAAVKIDHSQSGAVYTGLAQAAYAGGWALYAVNFHAGTVEVYDGNFNQFSAPGGFQDPSLPPGYVPFNIWAAGNKLYVSFALQDAGKTNPVAGPGNGFLDLFDVNGSLVQRVGGGAPLNAPWGMAIAPPKFGDFAGALLVANFGDGTVDAFDLVNSRLLGVLGNVAGQPLSIPGLRALAVGNGSGAGDSNTVYFTATATGGLFGGLQAAPIIGNNGIVNAAGYQLGAAPSTYVSILGNNLASTTRSWQSSDFVNGALPRSLDGVSVTVNGVPAYIAYISPTQLNVLLPSATSPGSLTVTNQSLAGTPVPLQFYPLAPAFFQFGNSGFVAALHSDGTLIGPLGMFSSSTRPARAGEVISLYGNGFGPTGPSAPDGSLIPSPLAVLSEPLILIGGQPAQVIYGGLVNAGLYQFNVVVPQIDPGNATVTAQLGSAISPAAMLAVQ
jgi:uncharacterized protein (TIGR03118 family)